VSDAPVVEPTFTEDRLLGGRIRLRQPAEGYRAAIDPVFLAASVPAEPHQLVLDVERVGAARLGDDRRSVASAPASVARRL